MRKRERGEKVELKMLSDEELKDRQLSEENDTKNSVDDEENLLGTHPPPPRSMSASFVINSAFGKAVLTFDIVLQKRMRRSNAGMQYNSAFGKNKTMSRLKIS